MAQQRLGFLKPFLSRAKEMAKLEAPAVPAEDLGSVLNIHMGGWFINTYNSSSRRCYNLIRALWASSCMWHIHIKLGIYTYP